MALPPVNGLALCAGAGGLELGLRLVLGSRYHVVCHVERDTFAAACLVARMADEAVDQAPVWDDVATFDGRPWRGVVDLVTCGFPCQPWSEAGQRRGLADDRWIWSEIARVVGEVGPTLVFLENVPGLTTGGGLGAVLGSLADLGLDAEWDCFAAGDLGAPHLRRRLFILGWRADGWTMADGDRDDRHLHAGRRPEGPRAVEPVGSGAPLADASHERPIRSPSDRRRRDADDTRDRTRPPLGGQDVADAGHPGPEGTVDPQPGGRTGVDRPHPLFPPAPDDDAGWERALRAGMPQPAVCRSSHGLADRLDRLHTIGNGVVPLVAGYAFVALARRVGFDMGTAAVTAEGERRTA